MKLCIEGDIYFIPKFHILETGTVKLSIETGLTCWLSTAAAPVAWPLLLVYVSTPRHLTNCDPTRTTNPEPETTPRTPPPTSVAACYPFRSVVCRRKTNRKPLENPRAARPITEAGGESRRASAQIAAVPACRSRRGRGGAPRASARPSPD
jgi:hypothetical protein